MLSEDYKKPSTDEKKAFYYFGFERLAPFKDVKEVILPSTLKWVTV